MRLTMNYKTCPEFNQFLRYLLIKSAPVLLSNKPGVLLRLTNYGIVAGGENTIYSACIGVKFRVYWGWNARCSATTAGSRSVCFLTAGRWLTAWNSTR